MRRNQFKASWCNHKITVGLLLLWDVRTSSVSPQAFRRQASERAWRRPGWAWWERARHGPRGRLRLSRQTRLWQTQRQWQIVSGCSESANVSERIGCHGDVMHQHVCFVPCLLQQSEERGEAQWERLQQLGQREGWSEVRLFLHIAYFSPLSKTLAGKKKVTFWCWECHLVSSVRPSRLPPLRRPRREKKPHLLDLRTSEDQFYYNGGCSGCREKPVTSATSHHLGPRIARLHVAFGPRASV